MPNLDPIVIGAIYLLHEDDNSNSDALFNSGSVFPQYFLEEGNHRCSADTDPQHLIPDAERLPVASALTFQFVPSW